jgi:hypothetical protein
LLPFLSVALLLETQHMQKLKFTIVVSIFIALYSCSEPIEKVAELALKNAATSVFSFNNNKADTFNLSTGSSIVVPANSIVDSSGIPVKGEVKISFEEFHSKAEIMLSKLPMTYKDSIFESAGMFSIQANCEGRPVFIDSKKPLTVTVASEIKDDDFNLYALKDSSWNFVEKAVIKEEMIECTGDQVTKKPLEVLTSNNKDIKLIEFDIDYSNMPELKDFKDVMWTYTGTSKEENPHSNAWVLKEEWTDANITRSGEKGKYIVALSKKGKTFSTVLSPVFSAKDQEKAKVQFEISLNQLKEYKDYEVENERKLFGTSASLNNKVQRIANIIGFGSYNFDKCKKGETLQAAFNFNYNNKVLNANRAYLIVAKTMVPYIGEGGLITLKIPLQEKFKVAVAINDSTMGFVRAEDFAKIISQKSLQKSGVKLEVRKYAVNITSKEDLEKFMTEL